MPFAITQSCCSDASCVAVCPVNCIHPTPDEPDFATAEMLYIDPRTCIDCGACADACPVDAVKPLELLRGPDAAYGEINRAHYADDAEPAVWDPPVFPAALTPEAAGLRVAVIGTGPSACYTASALLTTSAEVTMLERLDVPGGLVRFGVAPDHLATRGIAQRFSTVLRHPRLRLRTGIEVGVDVTHEELLAHHDAIVYATGATADRRLEVPGEDLAGSLPARRFVGWYNAHPDIPADAVDLSPGSSGRAVVVGTGNVALDMARILLADPESLVRTEIAGHALAALRRSTVHEVVLLARRGPAETAWSLAELRPLLVLPDLDVVVDAGSDDLEVIAAAAPGSRAGALQGLPSVSAPVAPGRRRLVLRFRSAVDAVLGSEGRVAAVRIASTADPDAAPERLPADLLLRSIGYRSEPIAALPFDETTHTVPHDAGRVVTADGAPLPGTYVVGWLKRGPRGGIGSNRGDAAETVASIVADANAGLLGPAAGPTGVRRRSRRDLDRLLRRGRSLRAAPETW